MRHIWNKLLEIMHGLVYIDYMRPIPLLDIGFGSSGSGGNLRKKVGSLCRVLRPKARRFERYVPMLVAVHQFQCQGQTTVLVRGAFQ
jgi:hypothetical protein